MILHDFYISSNFSMNFTAMNFSLQQTSITARFIISPLSKERKERIGGVDLSG